MTRDKNYDKLQLIAKRIDDLVDSTYGELNWALRDISRVARDAERPVGDTSTHKVSEDDLAEIMISLANSIQQAGGGMPSLYEMKTMSAFELIRRLAPNNVRFQYYKYE